jgi:hypothetical protein
MISVEVIGIGKVFFTDAISAQERFTEKVRKTSPGTPDHEDGYLRDLGVLLFGLVSSAAHVLPNFGPRS